MIIAKRVDLPKDRLDKMIPVPPVSRVPPPGVWFQAFTVVIMSHAWVPSVGRILRVEKMIRMANKPGCGRCQRRKNLMNRYGWRGLPRLLCSREFWFGKQRKGDVTWQKEQLPERRPTTVTS